MRHSFFFDLLMISFLAGMTVSCSHSGSDEVFLISQLEKQPEFEGGYELFMLYLSEEIKNAPEGTFDEVEGKIFIDFVIDRAGNISNVSFKSSLSSGAAKELKLILENSPSWRPGQLKGKPVASYQTLPIKF
ncbi:energy transducer TonB [Algoriphagus namhaensis]